MAIADYVILSVIALSAIIGLFRGFFREALSLATWIIAFFVAFQFGPLLAEQLSSQIETPSVRLAGAYVALFIGTLIVGGLINYFVSKLVKGSGLAGTDKVLGLFFGGIRGVILVLLFILLAGVTVISKDPWYQNSVVLRQMTPWAEQLRGLLPADMDEYLDPAVPADGGQKPETSDSSS